MSYQGASWGPGKFAQIDDALRRRGGFSSEERACIIAELRDPKARRLWYTQHVRERWDLFVIDRSERNPHVRMSDTLRQLVDDIEIQDALERGVG